MSELLKEIIGDSDDEFQDDDDFEYSSATSEEGIEEKDDDEIIEQTKANLTFKNHSDRKQELKHNKHTKSKIKINHDDHQILEISEEEMQHYQQLKLYGISGPPKKEKVQLSEEINFKLDVLQSSKMSFENIQPSLITIYSGHKAFDDQVIYYRDNFWRDENAVVTQPRFLVDTLPHAKYSEYLKQLMSRTEHMCCMSSDMKYLYIYGGKSKRLIHNDFIQYEIQNRKLNVYNNLIFASRSSDGDVISIPATVGGEMFEIAGCIYIIGRGEKSKATHIYTIENLNDPMAVVYGESCGLPHYYQYPNNRYLFDYRTNFTLNCQTDVQQRLDSRLHMFMFGGKLEGKAVDEMIILRMATKNTKTTFAHILKNPKEGDWPSARFSHSSCMIGDLIFIYGGINSKNQILNDLYMFDTDTQTWTEVSVESMLPPPLYRHHAFTVNTSSQSFYIYGGQTNQQVSNSLFRYDIVDKKWSLIEVISDVIERNENVTGYKCVGANNNLFIIGGSVGQDNSCPTRPFKALLNVNDPGKPIPICNYLYTKRKEGYLCDIVFRCNDMNSSGSISYILAHRCVLNTRCSFLTGKFSKCTEFMDTHCFEGTFLNDKIGVVDISECHTNILEKYLEYLYMGSLYLENSEMVHKFLEFVKEISPTRHYPFIEKICSMDSRKDLSLTREILKELYKDLATLIDDSTYNDLVIVLDQDNPFAQPPPSSIETEEEFNDILSPLTPGIPTGGISVHRLIMSRSPFFSRMFVHSKMMEATEKVVHLTDYSKDVMIEMLKYLYTDIIQLSSSNCLGVMIYSLMFDLTDLASSSRRMVISLLDKTTVWVVHEIAILYNEKLLESECESYMANNFEVLNSSSSFLELPETTRIKIKQLYEKRYHKKTK